MKNPFWRLFTRREGFIFYKNTFSLRHKSGETVQITVESRDPKLVAYLANSIKATYDPNTKATKSRSCPDYDVWETFNDLMDYK